MQNLEQSFLGWVLPSSPSHPVLWSRVAVLVEETFTSTSYLIAFHQLLLKILEVYRSALKYALWNCRLWKWAADEDRSNLCSSTAIHTVASAMTIWICTVVFTEILHRYKIVFFKIFDKCNNLFLACPRSCNYIPVLQKSTLYILLTLPNVICLVSGFCCCIGR